MAPRALRLLTLTALLAASWPVWAQDETAAPDDVAPSMQDILNSLEQAPPAPEPEPEPEAEQSGITPDAAPPVPARNDTLQHINPNAVTETVIPTGTMVKPAVTDSQPTETVPDQPLENMNPALMPQTPAGDAPKAVRAETAPVPPKPPAYEALPFTTLQTLDKVTARTATMTVKVGDTVAIGPLFVQVKTCQKAAPLETPDSAAFLQVWEARPKDAPAGNPDDQGPSRWVYSGWMFASSPALSAMDHPIYDIWVLNCKKSDKDEPEKSAEVKKPAAKTSTDTPVEPDAEAGDAEAAPEEAAPDVAPSKTPAKAAASQPE